MLLIYVHRILPHWLLDTTVRAMGWTLNGIGCFAAPCAHASAKLAAKLRRFDETAK